MNQDSSSSEKFWCLICEHEGHSASTYSREGMFQHLRTTHGVTAPDEGENYENDRDKPARRARELRQAVAEAERRARIVDWECEQAAGEMENIDTVADFLRACGVPS